MTYRKGKTFKDVRIMSGNTTAISYANNKREIKFELSNNIAKELWIWCIYQKLWISAAHIPGTQNIEAEFTEWKLQPQLFDKISRELSIPTIYLFMSQINH